MPEPVEERYKDLLHPIKDPEKSFAVNISELLSNYITNFLQGRIPPNFNSAALLLQGSSSIYGKKVEYLHNLASQLYSSLIKNKKDDQAKKDPKEKERVAKEKENRLNDPFFSTEIKPGKNLSCLRKKKSQQQATKKAQKKSDKKFTFVPVDLLPLEGEAKGDVFYDTRGEAIGNKNDYTLNKCRIVTSGWLLLPTVSQSMIPTSPSSFDYTLEPDSIEDDSFCIGDADMVDSSPPDEGYPGSDGCASLPSSQATSTQPASSQHSDEGFGSVPSSPIEGCSQPLSTAIQPHEPEPMELVSESAVAGTAPVAEDRENVPTEGAGDDVALRRHSLRQALKLCQLEQDAAQDAADGQNKEQENEIPAVKKVIQKKTVSSLPTRLRVPGDDLYIQTASEFCARTFFSMDNKVLKSAINKFGVTAFGINSKLIKTISSHSDFMRSYTRNRKKSNFDPDPDDEDSLDMLNPSVELMKDGDSYGSLLAPPVLDDAEIVIENDPIIPEMEEEPVNILDDDIAPVPSTSDEEDFLLGDDNRYQSFEAHAHECISNALRKTGVDKNAQIRKKVQEWEETIKPFLDELDKREKFDINVYGSRILDAFEDSNRKQTLCFREFCRGKEQWEIHRYFMALLPLINIGNVNIECEPHPEVNEDIFVTLLSRKMHHKELEEFGGHDDEGHC